ncbi:MAG: hypothetical protein JWO83_4511 [Caulobacteraceae bacterium]|nr:hypothetical protein [Caulobacteraceae bacterium]
MASLASILEIIGPLIARLTDITTQAMAANETKDQATLDKLHADAVALADSLRPAGA